MRDVVVVAYLCVCVCFSFESFRVSTETHRVFYIRVHKQIILLWIGWLSQEQSLLSRHSWFCQFSYDLHHLQEVLSHANNGTNELLEVLLYKCMAPSRNKPGLFCIRWDPAPPKLLPYCHKLLRGVLTTVQYIYEGVQQKTHWYAQLIPCQELLPRNLSLPSGSLRHSLFFQRQALYSQYGAFKDALYHVLLVQTRLI